MSTEKTTTSRRSPQERRGVILPWPQLGLYAIILIAFSASGPIVFMSASKNEKQVQLEDEIAALRAALIQPAITSSEIFHDYGDVLTITPEANTVSRQDYAEGEPEEPTIGAGGDGDGNDKNKNQASSSPNKAERGPLLIDVDLTPPEVGDVIWVGSNLNMFNSPNFNDRENINHLDGVVQQLFAPHSDSLSFFLVTNIVTDSTGSKMYEITPIGLDGTTASQKFYIYEGVSVSGGEGRIGEPWSIGKVEILSHRAERTMPVIGNNYSIDPRQWSFGLFTEPSLETASFQDFLSYLRFETDDDFMFTVLNSIVQENGDMWLQVHQLDNQGEPNGVEAWVPWHVTDNGLSTRGVRTTVWDVKPWENRD